MKFRLSVFILLICAVLPSFAENLNFPDEVTVQEQSLKLNGAGWRKASWFNVKVYKAALYLEKKVKGSEIIATPQMKVIDLVFNRAIERDDLDRVWKETFEKSCGEKCSVNYQAFLKDLKTIKKKDQQRYIFTQSQLTVDRAGTTSVYKEKGLSELVLKTFIGDHPPTQELKNALLNIN